jgi:hypothetical protein
MDTLLKTLGALLMFLAARALLTLRTTPGLVLIVFGGAVSWYGHPLIGLAIAAGGALIYREQCHRSPYTRCLRCHGIGYRTARRLLGGKQLRRCRLCGGPGHRMRWGRALMNAYRRATYTGRAHTPEPGRAAPPAPRPAPPTYTDAVRDHLHRH